MLDVCRCPVLRRNKTWRRIFFFFFGSSRLLHIFLRYFRLDLRRGSEVAGSCVGIFAGTARSRVAVNRCGGFINWK